MLYGDRALADNLFWDGSRGNNFNENDNWSDPNGNNVANKPGPGDNAHFVRAGTPGDITVNFQSGQFVNAIRFQNTNHLITLRDGNNGPQFAQVGQGGISIFPSFLGGAVTIDPAIVLGASHTWDIQDNNATLGVTREINLEGYTLLISGNGNVVADAKWVNGTHTGNPGRVVMNSAGTLRLRGATEFANLSVSKGTAILSQAAAPGAGQIFINGGAAVGIEVSGAGLFPFGQAGQCAHLNGVTGSRAEFQFRNSNDPATGSRTFWNGNIAVDGYGLITTRENPENVVGQVSGEVTGGGDLLTHGYVSFANANSFSGGTRIETGRLTLDHTLGLQLSTVNLASGDSGELRFSPVLSEATIGGLTGSRELYLRNDHLNPIELRIGNNNRSETYGGSLRGSGSLTKIGAGTQVLSGDSDFSGRTRIKGGTLELKSSLALKQSILDYNYGGALAVSGISAITLGGLEGSQSLNLNNVAVTIRNSSSTPSNYSGTLSGSGVSLVKTGGGEFILSGDSSFTGGTFVNSGTLRVAGSISGSTTVNAGILLGDGSVGSPGSSLTIEQQGILYGKLHVRGNVINRGEYLPDFRGGAANIDGNFAQSDTATLSVLLNPNHLQDQPAVVLGQADLGGALNLDLTEILGTSKTEYLVLLAGSFAKTNGAIKKFQRLEIPSGYSFLLSYQERPGTLSAALAATLTGVPNVTTQPDSLLNPRHLAGISLDPEAINCFAHALYSPDTPFTFSDNTTIYGLRYFYDIANRGQWNIDFDDLNAFARLISASGGGSLESAEAALSAAYGDEVARYVPEPEAWILLTVGVVCLCAMRRRTVVSAKDFVGSADSRI